MEQGEGRGDEWMGCMYEERGWRREERGEIREGKRRGKEKRDEREE